MRRLPGTPLARRLGTLGELGSTADDLGEWPDAGVTWRKASSKPLAEADVAEHAATPAEVSRRLSMLADRRSGVEGTPGKPMSLQRRARNQRCPREEKRRLSILS